MIRRAYNTGHVKTLIQKHEGRKKKLYLDSRGFRTIGVGRCLDKKPLTDAEVDYLYANDLRDARESAEKHGWFDGLSRVRRAVIIDMHYQLGAKGFRTFKMLNRALKIHDSKGAVHAMLDSAWAKDQTPKRAKELAKMMQTNKWPKWMK